MPNDLRKDLERRVAKAIKLANLTNTSLVVAVSGGPDSLALLYCLHRISSALGLDLHAAHLDHSLRPESSADAEFVSDICAHLGIELTSERINVDAHRQEHHLSLEEAARDVRYWFLSNVLREQGAHAVVTGHTFDDQAETVLMNILRGTGVTGLGGMRTVSYTTICNTKTTIVRPLLSVKHDETQEYCELSGLSPRIDPSNDSLEFTRNRIRHQVMPVLEVINPAIDAALVRLSENAQNTATILDQQVEETWDKLVTTDGGTVAINLQGLKQLQPALRSHLLHRVIGHIKGDLKGINQSHIENLTHIVDGAAGRESYLPGNIRAFVGYDDLIVTDGTTPSISPFEGEHTLAIPGSLIVGRWRFESAIVKGNPEFNEPGDQPPHAPDGFTAYLSSELIGDSLTTRARHSGDRFEPLGMNSEKKLKEFMIDAKIPRWWRDDIPLAVVSNRIAWVVGWRIANWAKVPDNAKSYLKIVASHHELS